MSKEDKENEKVEFDPSKYNFQKKRTKIIFKCPKCEITSNWNGLNNFVIFPNCGHTICTKCCKNYCKLKIDNDLVVLHQKTFSPTIKCFHKDCEVYPSNSRFFFFLRSMVDEKKMNYYSIFKKKAFEKREMVEKFVEKIVKSGLSLSQTLSLLIMVYKNKASSNMLPTQLQTIDLDFKDKHFQIKLDPRKKEVWNLDRSKFRFERQIKKRGLTEGIFQASYKIGYDSIEVAIKKLHYENDIKKDYIKSEVLNMHDARHENVIKCFGCWFEKEIAYIVMELGKQDLVEYVYHSEKKSDAKKIDVMLQVAMGIEYLHENSIIHYDLKPENILLCHNNVFKICDFGLSQRKLGKAHDVATMRGTPEYMAPEFYYENKKSLMNYKEYRDELKDIYSFGICMWEIWCETKPFEFCLKLSDIEALRILELSDDPEENDRLPTDGKYNVPKSLKDLMKRCWETDPKKRVQSFEEIVYELKKILKKSQMRKRSSSF